MNKSYKKINLIIANQRIRAPQLRVISDRGESLGIMNTRDALDRAREDEKDLVLIAEKSSPPVAKIIDLAKYKYQLQQKESESRKKARAQDIKEVRFSPFMGDNDFQSRLNKVKQFLKKGDKVRLSLWFKGRAVTKKEFGFNLFDQVFAATQDISQIEMKPKMMGSRLLAQLTPIKSAKKKTTDSGENL